MNMTEEPIIASTSKSDQVYHAARSGYDLIHGFFTNTPVQMVIVLSLIIGGNYLAGSPMNIVVILIGFFIASPFVWLLFPNASYSWILRTDLEKRIVHPEKIALTSGKDLLDKADAQQLFRDNYGTTCIVYGKAQGISETVTLSDVHYLNDITVLKKAINLLEPIIIELTELKHHRGLEVAALAQKADDHRARATAPLSSSAIGDLFNDSIKDTLDTPETLDPPDQDTV